MPSIAELVVYERHEPPQHVPLDPAIEVTIGRSSSCELPVRDRYLSRRHASIRSDEGNWVLRDLGSANGTWIDGKRIDGEVRLSSGTRIRIGDTELEFVLQAATDRVASLPDKRLFPTLSVPIDEADVLPGRRTLERVTTFNSLVLEALEEQPYHQLFPFMLERLSRHLDPSRAAIVLIGEGGTIDRVEWRKRDQNDDSEMLISRTIVSSMISERRAMAWNDVSADVHLSRSKSLAIQGIRSVACAPMLAHGNIIGLLYIDYLLHQRTIDEDDLLLLAQIARFAAIRIENARLREESMQKRLLEEEVRTAAAVQRQLLPAGPPEIPGWSIDTCSHASRGVSGDYYDFAIDPNGRLWIVVGDVSGKGINAALLMASLQAAFRIFVREELEPGPLCTRLNDALRGLLPANRFVTLFAMRIDPASGDVVYANAGHQPPLIVRAAGTRALDKGDLPLGMFEGGSWQTTAGRIEQGELLLIFTDGLAEIEGSDGAEFGDRRLGQVVTTLGGLDAREAVARLQEEAASFARTSARTDDLTIVAAARL